MPQQFERLHTRWPVLRDRSMPRDYSLNAVVGAPAFEAQLEATGVSRAAFRRLTAAQTLYLP